MQNCAEGQAEAAYCYLKHPVRRLVSLGLLGRNDLGEVNFQLGQSCREQVVVHIGDDGQMETLFKLAQRSNRVGPRLPARQGFGKRARFLVCGYEAEFLSELAHHGLKNLTVGPELALLGPDFEISEELQERGVINFLAVVQENRVQGRKNPSFPIDQGAIAVESQCSEAVEVEHGVQTHSRIYRWAAVFCRSVFRAGCRA